MEKLKGLAIPAAILVAGLGVALAVTFGHRYEFRQSANVLWVTDRLTGGVKYCVYPTSGLVDQKFPPSCVDLTGDPWRITKTERVYSDAEVGLASPKTEGQNSPP